MQFSERAEFCDRFLLKCVPSAISVEIRSLTYMHLHSHRQPVPKCKCCECNTFAMVRIHVQMFQAMSFKKYPLTNVSIFHYTWCNFAIQSWHHKNDFQIENICVLSCRSHLHMNLHYSKCAALTAFAFWHQVPMWVQIWFFILTTHISKESDRKIPRAR